VRCDSTSGEKWHAKGSRKEIEYKSLCRELQRIWYKERVVITVIVGTTGKATEGLKKFGSPTRKTFSRFTTTECNARNITHNMESIAV